MKERGSDLTIFSPRASFMAHHIGDFDVSSTWAAICNELCFRVSQLFPDHFIGAAMLPQCPGVDPKTCIPELEKCVQRLRLRRHQPEPRSVGRPLDEPAADRPALVPDLREDGRVRHPGDGPCLHELQPCFHTTGAHYINADTTAFMQFIQGDLFKDFPTLRFVIPHGGGAAPYHWGRYRGLAQELKKPPLTTTCSTTSSSTPASITSRASTS